jgi:hypothetical protein
MDIEDFLREAQRLSDGLVRARHRLQTDPHSPPLNHSAVAAEIDRLTAMADVVFASAQTRAARADLTAHRARRLVAAAARREQAREQQPEAGPEETQPRRRRQLIGTFGQRQRAYWE